MSFRDLPSAEENQAAPDIESFERDIEDLERRLAPFQTPVWDQIEVEISIELKRQTDQLVAGALSSDQVFQVRGRAQALRWALDLPRQIEADIRMLGTQLRELVSQATEEGE